jgi:predicted molibdopterin-dependent oxidoreductase YjgC
VVLPAQTWAETAGHIINIEGRELPVVPFMRPLQGAAADGVALVKLAEHLGHPFN